MSRLSSVHPGIILLEVFLVPLGISQDRLARDLGVHPYRIHEIVQGKRAISPDIALRLAHYFGMSERFWLDLQRRYDGERRYRRSTQIPAKQSLRYAGKLSGDVMRSCS